MINFTDSSGSLMGFRDNDIGFSLLQEDGFLILLESTNQSRLLLESNNLKSFADSSGSYINFTD